MVAPSLRKCDHCIDVLAPSALTVTSVIMWLTYYILSGASLWILQETAPGRRVEMTRLDEAET